MLASAVLGAALWWGRSSVEWTALAWTLRAAGVLVMVAAAAVLYFGVMFAAGWRLSELRPARGED